MSAKVLETGLKGEMRIRSRLPRAGSLGFLPPFLSPHGVPRPGTSLTCSRKRPQETEENKAVTAALRLTGRHLSHSYYTFCARLLRAPLALTMEAAGASWAFGDFTSIYSLRKHRGLRGHLEEHPRMEVEWHLRLGATPTTSCHQKPLDPITEVSPHDKRQVIY